jgi:RNA polymerase sigma-70 factor (ECF subfamily)
MVGFLGDFDLAEEAAQAAFVQAAARWPQSGEPANPGAWLISTARNYAIDRIRRRRTLERKAALLRTEAQDATDQPMDDAPIQDERLELIFMCCHPALALDAQVALTLRALGGLTTEEIARAFLTTNETMKRRLSRAKAKIKATVIPFALPAEHLLPDRLNAVLAVVYLIFNEGYGGRADLAQEAISLGAVLAELMPDEPEVSGLNALMHLHHARASARHANGELVLLKDQDRSRWDEHELEQGRRTLDRAIAQHGNGQYVLQAAIAALQVELEIDWAQVALLYDQLAQLTGSPVVKLNQAVALAEAGEPQRALELVDALELDGYRYFHSTRGELLTRLNRTDDAKLAYAKALELTDNEPERLFLEQRLSNQGRIS